MDASDCAAEIPVPGSWATGVCVCVCGGLCVRVQVRHGVREGGGRNM